MWLKYRKHCQLAAWSGTRSSSCNKRFISLLPTKMLNVTSPNTDHGGTPLLTDLSLDIEPFVTTTLWTWPPSQFLTHLVVRLSNPRLIILETKIPCWTVPNALYRCASFQKYLPKQSPILQIGKIPCENLRVLLLSWLWGLPPNLSMLGRGKADHRIKLSFWTVHGWTMPKAEFIGTH